MSLNLEKYVHCLQLAPMLKYAHCLQLDLVCGGGPYRSRLMNVHWVDLNKRYKWQEIPLTTGATCNQAVNSCSPIFWSSYPYNCIYFLKRCLYGQIFPKRLHWFWKHHCNQVVVGILRPTMLEYWGKHEFLVYTSIQIRIKQPKEHVIYARVLVLAQTWQGKIKVCG